MPVRMVWGRIRITLAGRKKLIAALSSLFKALSDYSNKLFELFIISNIKIALREGYLNSTFLE
jgi:hypothetical protein